MKKLFLLGSFLFLFACSELELSEKDRIRREKARGEFIEREKEEVCYPYLPPTLQKKAPYPWEEKRSSW